jgi:hypothetical protein
MALNHSNPTTLNFPTPESIEAAKLYNASEREKARLECGLILAKDGTVAEIRPLHVAAIQDAVIQDLYNLPLSLKLKCSERMSELVEEFGYPCVERAFRCEAAANDLVVRVLDANEAEDY